MSADDLEVTELAPGCPGGPVVVLVHGMEDTWQSWRPFAAQLDPHWRVYALDLPWRTGNSYDWRRHGTAAGWLTRALRQLDAPVDALVGHSLGANAVLELLAGADAPTVRTAALLAPFYCPPHAPHSWALFDEARRYFDRIITDGIRIRLGPRAAALDEQLRGTMLEKMLDRIGPVGFLAWFDHFVASCRLELAAVTVPTLVLASPDDPCLGDGRADALARAMPAATLWLDRGYDHFCHLQQAATAAAQLVRFAAPRLAGERSRA